MRAHREHAVIKFIVIVALLLIVGSLGSALYYLYHDRGQGTRMVKALAIRVALSAAFAEVSHPSIKKPHGTLPAAFF